MINLLTKDFENFFMKQDEPIVDRITHFTDIINVLKAFDRKFINGELVSKMLRPLSKDWNSWKLLMENTKEKTRRNKEEMKKPPKKQIALKSTNDEGSSNTNMSDEELDDLVLLVKKWR
ncbi:UBN2 domain-containing protein [Abeliophyllum distichum]|uniref:UBN2 domain-containing protein n=1 Tax=Abeliophyllum distichum TaxID=126358 RepID=A0ABD1Q515_9LAMI